MSNLIHTYTAELAGPIRTVVHKEFMHYSFARLDTTMPPPLCTPSPEALQRLHEMFACLTQAALCDEMNGTAEPLRAFCQITRTPAGSPRWVQAEVASVHHPIDVDPHTAIVGAIVAFDDGIYIPMVLRDAVAQNLVRMLLTQAATMPFYPSALAETREVLLAAMESCALAVVRREFERGL